VFLGCHGQSIERRSPSFKFFSFSLLRLICARSVDPSPSSSKRVCQLLVCVSSFPIIEGPPTGARMLLRSPQLLFPFPNSADFFLPMNQPTPPFPPLPNREFSSLSPIGGRKVCRVSSLFFFPSTNRFDVLPSPPPPREQQLIFFLSTSLADAGPSSCYLSSPASSPSAQLPL